MSKTYKDFPIKGFDVSHWNDNNETVYFPTFDKLVERGFKFVGVRTSYGVVADGDFKQFWNQAKGKLARIPYHYLDFYSHKLLGITAEVWGRRQAQFVWGLLKADPGEKQLCLDVENSSRYSITSGNKSEVGKIINAFFLEYDRLSGTTAGIYTNQGYLFVFGTAHKTRPLWFSWYNRRITIDQILAVLKNWNYTGKLEMLQYDSNGDIDDDGISDARAMGMESEGLDLNRWMAKEEEFPGYSAPATPEPDPAPEPVLESRVIVVAAKGLKVRSGPGQVFARIGALAKGISRDVVETQRDFAGNLWVKVLEGWICAQFGTVHLAEILK